MVQKKACHSQLVTSLLKSGRRGSNPRHPAWEGAQPFSHTAKTRRKCQPTSEPHSHSFYKFGRFTTILSRILSRHLTAIVAPIARCGYCKAKGEYIPPGRVMRPGGG